MDFRILHVENELTYLNISPLRIFHWFLYKNRICYFFNHGLNKETFQERANSEITILFYE